MIPETTTADIKVPKNAYIIIPPKFLKNGFLSMLYPASKIIGGRRNSRKKSTLRLIIGAKSPSYPIKDKNPEKRIPMIVATPASCKY